jgi:hypothetical protein
MNPEFRPLDPPLGDIRELRHRHRERIERERERLAVEVAVRDEELVVDENEGIVRSGVQLDGNGRLDVRQKIAGGAVDLWGATQGISVLNLVAPAVRFDDRGAVEQREDVGGGVDLAGQWARRVDLRQEARA